MNRKQGAGFAAVAVILISFSGILAFSIQSLEVEGKATRVACIGDSITHGGEYTYRLKDMLGPNYKVDNFGVDGSAVSLSSEKPYMNQSKFREALEFRPNVVLIM